MKTQKVRSDQIDIKDQLARSQQGNEEAFYGLYQILHQPLFRFLLSRSKTREDAQDILQELFIDLWRSLKRFSYKSDAHFYAFVYKIARRKLSKHYQSQTTSELDENKLPELLADFPEDFRYIHKAIGRLPDKYREVIELRYWSQLSHQEIANLLGLSENNVKVIHHRGLGKLQDYINQND